MVNSEDSTSLPGLTRRALLGSTALIHLAPVIGLHPATTCDADPVATLYQEWVQANAEALRWCCRWGELEAVLLRSLGYPRVSISLSDTPDIAWVSTHAEIDRRLMGMPGSEILSARLHTDLARHQALWDTQATSIGLVEAERQEAMAWERRESLALRTLSLPANNLPNVVTKLTLILRMGEARESDGEFPWPQINSVIADLQRLTGA